MKSVFFRRLALSKTLGLLSGILMSFLYSFTYADPIIWTPIMWAIIYQYLFLGVVVGVFGFFVRHPLFPLRFYSWFRGFIVGIFFNLQGALWLWADPEAWYISWTDIIFSIICGGIIGMIIDILSTKFGGEGKIMSQEQE